MDLYILVGKNQKKHVYMLPLVRKKGTDIQRYTQYLYIYIHIYTHI